MKSNAAKQISLVILASFLLSACGGGSSDDRQTSTGPNTSVDPKDPTIPEKTKNIMTFPINEFQVRSMSVGTNTDFYTILQKDSSLLNTQVSVAVQGVYSQKPDYQFKWTISQQYLLTKDKLYYAKDGLHQQYVIKNDDSTLVLGYEADGKGLTSTIKFKNINLANEMINSDKVKTDLFGGYTKFNKDDSNFIKLRNSIDQISGQFEKDAVCHQYLTQQFNQPNIIFSEFFANTQGTLSQWVAEQRSKGSTVVEETWAGYKVAYIKDPDEINFYHRLGQRSPYVVVEMDGVLKQGTINFGEVYDYQEEYDNPSQFEVGICNSYNASATRSLNQAIINLPKM